MTLTEAIAAQPSWISWWLNIMLVGIFIVPLALLIWRSTRILAIALLIAGVLSAVAVGYIYNNFGYIKLLGVPHIILYTPLVLFMFRSIKSDDVPVWPRRLMMVALATILISLAFDYTDAIRYILGERTPLAMPA